MSTGNTIRRNFAVLSMGQVASKVLAFLITIYIAKVLLPERFGAVVFASGTLLYATLLLDFGFEQYGPIEVGRGDTDLRKLAGNVMTWRCIFLLPALAAFFLIANLIPVPPFTRLVIELYGLSLFTNAFDLGWVFLGTKQMWPSAVSEIITQMTLVIGAFLLIHSPAQAFYMPILFTAGRTIAVTFVLALFVKQFGAIKFGVERSYIAKLLRSAMPLWGSQIMGMVLTNFDLLLIGLWMGAASVGVYGAATRLVWMPTTFAVAYYSSLRPVLSNSYVTGFASIEPLFNKMVRVSTALAAGVFVGASLLATPIMVQLFGENYRSGAPALALLSAAFFVMLMRTNYRCVLQTYNLQLVDLRNICTAAVVSVILNVCFIPLLGIAGAALGNVAAELTILFLNYRAAAKVIRHQPVLPHALRTLLCCAVMAGCIFVTNAIGSIYIRAALAGLAYFVAMIVSGIISLEDLAAMCAAILPKKSAVTVKEAATFSPKTPTAKPSASRDLVVPGRNK